MSLRLTRQCITSFHRPGKPRESCICLLSAFARDSQPRRTLATSRYDEDFPEPMQPEERGGEVTVNTIPRWKETPPQMRAPFRSKPPTLKPNDYSVNEDPKRLDRAYVEILGNKGDEMLPEEIKWLAITHKSFDHGRRGYNDRLAFLGISALRVRRSIY